MLPFMYDKIKHQSVCPQSYITSDLKSKEDVDF